MFIFLLLVAGTGKKLQKIILNFYVDTETSKKSISGADA